MPIFTKDNKSFLFIHIPKCGGSSIETTFRKNGFRISYLDGNGENTLNHLRLCSPQHMHGNMLSNTFNLSAFDGIFTVVRDPESRIKSEIGMRIGKKLDHTEKQTDHWISNTFQRYKKNNFIFDNHIRPQSEFIIPESQLYKFEDGINNIIKDISDTFNLGLIGYENLHVMSRKKMNGYKSSDIPLSQKSKKSIKEFYKEDFLMLY